MPISFDIPEGEIRNAIAVAVAESFTADRRDALLRDIIRAHLQYRENAYDKETLLSKAVGQVIRKVGMEEVARQLETMRPDIERIVADLMGPQFREGVYRALRSSLGRIVVDNLIVSVELAKPTED